MHHKGPFTGSNIPTPRDAAGMGRVHRFESVSVEGEEHKGAQGTKTINRGEGRLGLGRNADGEEKGGKAWVKVGAKSKEKRERRKGKREKGRKRREMERRGREGEGPHT